MGAPMVTDGRYTSPGHKRGGLVQKEVLYDNFRKAWLVAKGWAKLGCCKGLYCCLGALMGAPMVSDVWYTSAGHGRGVLRQKIVLYDNFRIAWLVSTHLERGQAKSGYCRGMYCRFGALMGAPMVLDGRYMSPGHRWGGLRRKNVLLDNFRKAWLVFSLRLLTQSMNLTFEIEHEYEECFSHPMGLWRVEPCSVFQGVYVSMFIYSNTSIWPYSVHRNVHCLRSTA